MKTPEEMRELYKKSKYGKTWEHPGSGEDGEFIKSACEFVPQAAEWMIKAKELLMKSVSRLDDAIEIMEDSAPYTARKTCELSFEINKFLESPHDQT